MKIWKRIGAMAMVTAFSALALTGCGGGSSSGGGDSAGSDGWNIGYVNLADTDVFCMARESALTTELDGTGYSVSFSDGNNDNQKQIDQTNAFLAKGVDALILVPADSDAIAPAISAANSKGTPVICLGIKANSGDFTFVGSENYDSGHMQGEYMAENLPQGAKVLYLAGTAGLQHSADQAAMTSPFWLTRTAITLRTKQCVSATLGFRLTLRAARPISTQLYVQTTRWLWVLWNP